MSNKHWVGVGASIFLGLVFTVAGLGKSLNHDGAFEIFIFSGYLPPALNEAAYIWLPRLELAIGLLLILGVAARFVTSFALVLIAGFIANNSWFFTHGLGDRPCDCFGVAERIAQLKLTTTGALYLDVVMLVFGIVVLVCYQSSFFNIHPWFLRKGKGG